MINEIVEGNNDTDSGEYFYNLYYHFNRNMTESSSNAKFEYWVLLQKTKIEIILMLRKIKNPHPMTPEIENICSCALNKMGILSHMGQDFYAHAVSYGTSTNDFDSSVFSSMSQSIINGEFMLSMNSMSTQIHNVIIGSNPGTIPTFSSPDIPFFVKPSNYNGSWKSSEHGQIWTVEPGNRAADRKQRRQRAINWTYFTLKPLLMTWIEKCPCYEYGVLDYILPWRWL